MSGLADWRKDMTDGTDGNTEAANEDEVRFSPEEQKVIDEFKEKIDITDTGQILGYGADAQQKIASFSEMALSKVRTKDLGEVGEMIGDLVLELKGFDTEEEKKGLFGLFRKGKDRIAVLKSRYDQAETNVDRIAGMLEEHQRTLTKDAPCWIRCTISIWKISGSCPCISQPADRSWRKSESGSSCTDGEGKSRRSAGGCTEGERSLRILRAFRKETSRSGTDAHGGAADGAADTSGAE